MQYSPKFLAQHLAMPTDLTGVDECLIQLYGEFHPRRFAQCRRELLGSTARRTSYVTSGGLHPAGPDAGEIKRDADSVRAYLENLIAPEHVAGARPVICEFLDITELDQIAADTAKLHPLMFDCVTALLELRPIRAMQYYERDLALMTDEQRKRLRGKGVDVNQLVAEYERIRIAYLLRCTAQSCGAQIAEPTGWPVLDRLDGGDSVKVGSVIQRLLRELALAERAIKLYDKGRRAAGGLLARNVRAMSPGVTVSFPNVDLPVSKRDAKQFIDLDLDRQAKDMLQTWRTAHGSSLEAVLDRTVEQIRRELAILRARLQARVRADHHNKVLGNIGRCKAGLRLYLAVEEAIAWLGKTVPPAAGKLVKAPRGKTVAEPGEPVGAVRAALHCGKKQGKAAQRYLIPDRCRNQAFDVVQLFTALRFAFLHDNEMLPVSLRKVQNKTGEIVQVKTPARAADVLGRAYSFEELWDAHEQHRSERAKKLPPLKSKKKPTSGPASETDQTPRFANFAPDNEYRAAADKLHRTPVLDLPRGERSMLGEFRAQIASEYGSA